MIKYPDLKTLRILHYPDPRLREHAVSLKELDSFLNEMAARMNELMVAAQGMGLAATQVGWPFRFVIINTENEPGREETFINPVIIAREGKQIGEEGCLSVPGIFGKVRRAEKVRVRATLPSGEEVEFDAEGLAARAWQHEIDHLDGGLFVDRLGPAAKVMISGQLRALKERFDAGRPADEPGGGRTRL